MRSRRPRIHLIGAACRLRPGCSQRSFVLRLNIVIRDRTLPAALGLALRSFLLLLTLFFLIACARRSLSVGAISPVIWFKYHKLLLSYPLLPRRYHHIYDLIDTFSTIVALNRA